MEEFKLVKREEGFFIECGGQRVPVTDREAAEVMEDPSKIYDAVVRHTRKFPFNTAEDKVEMHI